MMASYSLEDMVTRKDLNVFLIPVHAPAGEVPSEEAATLSVSFIIRIHFHILLQNVRVIWKIKHPCVGKTEYTT